MDDQEIPENKIQDLTFFLRNIKNFISQEIIDIASALFKKFSKEEGKVPSKDLEVMLRLLDFNPTMLEVKEMINNFKSSEDKDYITFEEFLICIARKKRDSDTIEELLACFRFLDKDATGKIPEPTLRYYLCNVAEKFENEEMDLFMKEATPFTEVINEVKYVKYNDFALFLKDLYQPPVVQPTKTKGGKK